MGIRKVDIAILTVIPQELTAVKAALGIQDIPDNRTRTQDSKTVYLHGELFSEQTQRNYSLALGCIGRAGNYNSSQAATEAILSYDPKLLVLLGIAAGIKGKAKLGEVVFSERIVGYESAALRQLEDGAKVEHRPDMLSVPTGIYQDAMFYLAAYKDLGSNNPKRLELSFKEKGGNYPTPADDQSYLQEHDIICGIEIDVCTIASGEKLLKDPQFLEDIRDQQHGRVKVGEMEAIGFSNACQTMQRDWLVVRGISDFGDSYKSDIFHPLASLTAATVLADFLQYGVDLGNTLIQDPKEQVLDLLNRLLPSQFDAVVFKYNAELAHLSNGTQNQKSIDLIRYASQREEANLLKLLSTIYTVVPHLKE
jgi:nucleoside phosphorylase